MWWKRAASSDADRGTLNGRTLRPQIPAVWQRTLLHRCITITCTDQLCSICLVPVARNGFQVEYSTELHPASGSVAARSDDPDLTAWFRSTDSVTCDTQQAGRVATPHPSSLNTGVEKDEVVALAYLRRAVSPCLPPLPPPPRPDTLFAMHVQSRVVLTCAPAAPPRPLRDPFCKARIEKPATKMAVLPRPAAEHPHLIRQPLSEYCNAAQFCPAPLLACRLSLVLQRGVSSGPWATPCMQRSTTVSPQVINPHTQ